MNELWIPVIFLLGTVGVLSLWLFLRHRGRSALQQTVQMAIEKGQDLSPELLDGLKLSQNSAFADLRRGIIAIAVAAAFAIFAFAIDEGDAVRPLLGISAFPFMLGVAYLALWRFAGNKDSN